MGLVRKHFVIGDLLQFVPFHFSGAPEDSCEEGQDHTKFCSVCDALMNSANYVSNHLEGLHYICIFCKKNRLSAYQKSISNAIAQVFSPKLWETSFLLENQFGPLLTD